MSRICVIVPVYQVKKYLRRCVDSILNQTYPNISVVLIDDGSPDRSGVICDEYAQKDSRIHVIHQVNGGLSAARNSGIDWAMGNEEIRWITFVDSDDWLHPEMLEQLYAIVQKYDTNVGVCSYALTDGKTPVATDMSWEVRVWKPEDFYVEENTTAVIACAKLYRKDCFRNLRYPVGKLHEDEFTTYKILFTQDKIAVTTMPLYYYFQNAQGITKSAWRPKRMDALEAMRNQITFFKKNGFVSAYEFTVPAYVNHILRQRKQFHETRLSVVKRIECSMQFCWALLSALAANWRVMMRREFRWILLDAFPRLTKLYSALLRLKGCKEE